jgi:hypothetical protein
MVNPWSLKKWKSIRYRQLVVIPVTSAHPTKVSLVISLFGTYFKLTRIGCAVYFWRFFVVPLCFKNQAHIDYCSLKSKNQYTSF